jgi:hypothetical protein
MGISCGSIPWRWKGESVHEQDFLFVRHGFKKFFVRLDRDTANQIYQPFDIRLVDGNAPPHQYLSDDGHVHR